MTMEGRPPLMTILFVSLWILLALFAINVESQQQQQQQQQQQTPSQQNGSEQNGNQGIVAPITPPPPPPSSSPVPRPPPSPPPTHSPRPPGHPPPPPGPPSPPPHHHQHPPPKDKTNLKSNHSFHKRNNSNLNPGKKIGLLFAGIVVILQIGVVGFLVFKRRQLLKMRDL